MKKRAVLGGVIAAVLLGYLGLGALAYVLQRPMLFPAPMVSKSSLDIEARRVGAVPIELVAEDGTRLYGWHRPGSAERAVVFFHGNGETVARLDLHNFLLQRGWHVVVVAYRGYPGSEGSPSEQGLYQDARAAWAFTTETLGIPRERIVIHGMSLGGGVASKLASEVDPAALVLESTFLSVPDVAGDRFWMFPTRALVRDRFETKNRTGDIHCPMLVVHGDGDPVIPVAHGRELGEIFTQATYVEVDSWHHGATHTVLEPAAREAYEALLSAVAEARP